MTTLKTIPITPMTRLPSEQAELVEEALSEIFECGENSLHSQMEIEPLLDKKVQTGILKQLIEKQYVQVKGEEIHLSPEGEKIATHVIRRKRLAERLLKDVLNLKEEHIDPAACQWEHVLSKEVTNSICTLLGHPSQSPKEQYIPPGECCRLEKTEITAVICSLDKLNRGERAKINYILLKNNPDLGRLLSLGLIPGATIEVVQKYPTFVVEVGESQLAFDETIAEAIFVHPIS